jgi:hypothetical protein
MPVVAVVESGEPQLCRGLVFGGGTNAPECQT